MKKIATEGPFSCGAVESEVARQDVDATLNKRMKKQGCVDDMQLFVWEVINKSLNLEEITEIADK